MSETTRCACGHPASEHTESGCYFHFGGGEFCKCRRQFPAPEPSAPADDARPPEHPDPDINFAIERAAMDLEGATGIDRAEFRRAVQDVIQEPPLPDRPGGFYERLEAMTEERDRLRTALAAAESRADALARENKELRIIVEDAARDLYDGAFGVPSDTEAASWLHGIIQRVATTLANSVANSTLDHCRP